MTIYFRYHRGTLKESLETQVEIKNRQQLIEMLKDNYAGISLQLDNIKKNIYRGLYEFTITGMDRGQSGYAVWCIGFICYDKYKLPGSFWSE